MSGYHAETLKKPAQAMWGDRSGTPRAHFDILVGGSNFDLKPPQDKEDMEVCSHARLIACIYLRSEAYEMVRLYACVLVLFLSQIFCNTNETPLI